MIDVLVIAVIGGLYRVEAAWLGAFVFVIINNYSQRISFVGPRFHTLIGLVFLAIVLVSPTGLIGLWERFLDLRHERQARRVGRPSRSSRSRRAAMRDQRMRRPINGVRATSQMYVVQAQSTKEEGNT